MDWLMRALFGFHPMMAVEDGVGGGEAAPEGEGSPPGLEPIVDDPSLPEVPIKPAAQETAVPPENAMLEGIKKALAPADPEADKAAAAEAAKVAEKKRADEEFAKTLTGKTPEEIASAKAAREADLKKKAEAEERASLKDKKADDFQLTPQMKRYLSGEAQQRFHTLHRYAKEQETRAAEVTEQFTAVSKARDELMGLFSDHHVEPEDLGVLLDYNKRLKSGDLQGALQIVDNARAGILRAMGKEAPGVDLLQEFPDLQQRVQNAELMREDALALANARRREQALMQHAGSQGAQQRAEATTRKSQEEALASIDGWAAKLAKEDIDYRAKEQKVLAKLPQIVKQYPPNLWLPTMQAMYEAIEIVKPAPAPDGGGAPLRPSGAKPGGRQYTELTPEALRAGLGYPAA
jgi:hypothetical protein